MGKPYVDTDTGTWVNTAVTILSPYLITTINTSQIVQLITTINTSQIVQLITTINTSQIVQLITRVATDILCTYCIVFMCKFCEQFTIEPILNAQYWLVPGTMFFKRKCISDGKKLVLSS